MDEKTEKQIAESFKHHPPHGDQAQRYEVLRSAGRSASTLIVASCPPSRERSLALTKLEEAFMWANKAIAVNE